MPSLKDQLKNYQTMSKPKIVLDIADNIKELTSLMRSKRYATNINSIARGVTDGSNLTHILEDNHQKVNPEFYKRINTRLEEKIKHIQDNKKLEDFVLLKRGPTKKFTSKEPTITEEIAAEFLLNALKSQVMMKLMHLRLQNGQNGQGEDDNQTDINLVTALVAHYPNIDI